MKCVAVLSLLLASLLWGGGVARSAGMKFNPRGLDASRVEMVIHSFTDKLPEGGFVDLWVEVRNRMPTDAEWEFHFRAYSRWNDAEVLRHTRVVGVAADSVRRVRLTVPLYPSMESGYSQSPRLAVSIAGPGSRREEQVIFRNSGKNSPDVTRYVLVSRGVRRNSPDANWDQSELEMVVQSDNLPLIFLNLDEERFPDSERSLLGVQMFVMREDEWNGFGSHQQTVERWLAQGGHLILLGGTHQPPESFGLGSIRTLPVSLSDMKQAANELRRIPTLSEKILNPDSFSETNWELRERFPDIRKPVGVLLVLVIGIAGVLGPLNLRIAFRNRNSLQVLWMTPVLSVGISLLIGVVILLGDGLGGKGARAQWVMILPEENLEVAWQEQVSRTGVLPRSGFTLEEDWWLRPVASGRQQRNLDYSYSLEAAGTYRGDWFRNRQVQAQVLQRVRSTRAEVRLTREEGTPRILSTVETPFDRVMVRDQTGEMWKAEKVTPGRAVSMVRMEPGAVNDLLDDFRTRKQSLFPGEALLQNKGWFYAEGGSADRMVDTLTAVSWQDSPVWFFGPVVEELP